MLNCWWCHATTDLHASADPGSYDHRLNWAPLPINRVCGFRWPEPVPSANHDPHTPSSAPSSNITCRKGSLFLAAPLGLQAPSLRQKVQPISLTYKPFWFEEQLGLLLSSSIIPLWITWDRSNIRVMPLCDWHCRSSTPRFKIQGFVFRLLGILEVPCFMQFIHAEI